MALCYIGFSRFCSIWLHWSNICNRDGNMIEVFYYRDANAMERKTGEFVYIYIGTGLYAVVGYLVQHYFFSIMGENLTTGVRRMMLSVILRNEVGWFDEEENNSSLIAARLATYIADVKSAIAERISVILQNMTALLTSFIVGFVIEWRVALLILATFPLHGEGLHGHNHQLYQAVRPAAGQTLQIGAHL